MGLIKNVRKFKTTLFGVLFCAAALIYLFHYGKENVTIFFGLLILGLFLVFAPDTIFKDGQKVLFKLLRITTKSDDVDDDSPNNTPDDIPNER